MAVSLFLAPMVQGEDSLIGRYTEDEWSGAFGVPVRTGTIRYGREEDAVIMIQAPQSYLDEVGSQPDATLLATQNNIDNPVNGSQANAAKTIFENAFLPDRFINPGDTRREVLRKVVGAHLFSQRCEGRFGENWKKKAKAQGLTLNSTWSQFPQPVKDALFDIRDSFGWEGNLGITNTSDMRDILEAVSNQFVGHPFFIGGFEI